MLNLKERIVISNILPTKGNFTMMIIKSDISNKLKVTQDEISEFDIVSEGNQIRFNIEKDSNKDFILTDAETNMIKESLSNLDKSGELDDSTFELFKKFNQ